MLLIETKIGNLNSLARCCELSFSDIITKAGGNNRGKPTNRNLARQLTD